MSGAVRDPELDVAEALESRAAGERVAYYDRHLGRRPEDRPPRLLDVGCGNGYAVAEWTRRGVGAVGVDNSTYRLGRWLAEKERRTLLVVADAARLPFLGGSFEATVSSGMIEHVGVEESRPPYRVRALPGRDALRRRVVGELLRVVAAEGPVFLDFPNGSFPVDFWHGDRAGAFRVHPVPDPLLPSYRDVAGWTAPPATPRLLPLRGRLRFRQVSRHWWGRLFRLPMAALIGTLDALRPLLPASLLAPLYPFLVVEIRRR